VWIKEGFFMDSLLGYFKMTTLLALNLKEVIFFCSDFEYFLSGWCQKQPATRVAEMKVVAPKSPVPMGMALRFAGM